MGKLILTVNSGSSSIKVEIFEKDTYKVIYKEEIERVKNHKKSFKKTFKKIREFSNIVAIGHRIVHGGEKYTKTTRITDKVLKELEELSALAPLHNPYNIIGIKSCLKLLPGVRNYAVFDTDFYSTLPEKAFLYALPYSLYRKHGIRRYGFHGTSHKYVVNKALSHIKSKKTGYKVVSCHIGNGVSLTASIDRKAIDTSMGFTPLEGIPMGTRCGDIDPAIIFYLNENRIYKLKKLHHMLEHESGLKGLSELSNDVRNLRDAFFKKNSPKKDKEAAARAMEVYCYRMAKYIGGYAAAMGGLDCIIFTAGVGERAPYIRKWICEYLEFLGVKLDSAKNRRCTDTKTLKEIHKKGSKVKTLVIPTNEALQIAKEA